MSNGSMLCTTQYSAENLALAGEVTLPRDPRVPSDMAALLSEGAGTTVYSAYQAGLALRAATEAKQIDRDKETVKP